MSSLIIGEKRRLEETSTQSQMEKKPKQAVKSMGLTELVEFIDQEMTKDTKTALHKRKEIEQALREYCGDMEELKRYALFEPSKNYTRNLIATDNETYALMLLCWNKGKYSPIHDHPCDGCFVRLIQGQVNEVRYVKEKGVLVETSNEMVSEGVSFMHDSMGYHKIGNPSDTVDAITLHLYCPPYDKCHLWFDTNDAEKISVAVSSFYSEYGEKNDV